MTVPCLTIWRLWWHRDSRESTPTEERDKGPTSNSQSRPLSHSGLERGNCTKVTYRYRLDASRVNRPPIFYESSPISALVSRLPARPRIKLFCRYGIYRIVNTHCFRPSLLCISDCKYIFYACFNVLRKCFISVSAIASMSLKILRILIVKVCCLVYVFSCSIAAYSALFTETSHCYCPTQLALATLWRHYCVIAAQQHKLLISYIFSVLLLLLLSRICYIFKWKFVENLWWWVCWGGIVPYPRKKINCRFVPHAKLMLHQQIGVVGVAVTKILKNGQG